MVPSLCVSDQPPISKSCQRSSLFMDASMVQAHPHPNEVFHVPPGPSWCAHGTWPTSIFRHSSQHALFFRHSSQNGAFFLTLLIFKCHLLYDVFWIHLRVLWSVCIRCCGLMRMLWFQTQEQQELGNWSARKRCWCSLHYAPSLIMKNYLMQYTRPCMHKCSAILIYIRQASFLW